MATCFVVQGFGKKTDFTDGRVLDLDASYAIIKEAVEAAGLQCIRADEITHAGTIDAPMYARLLESDLVIADLSTYNVNAAFELGVRYGLRPRATIIVAEEGFKNPFDVGHIVIRRYKHLGEDIGAKEAKRFRDDLKQAIAEILASGAIDSPVYTFLPGLTPPLMENVPPLARTALFAVDPAAAASSPPNNPNAPDSPETSAKSLLEQAQAKLRSCDFAGAVPLLTELHAQRPHDAFVVQQLALATYKSRQPSAEAALEKARDILRALDPATTNDPETLGLWGAVHKRLWDTRQHDEDLAASIDAYSRGFQLKQDSYNGINLAFLLELRAFRALQAGERDEGLTDAVLAKRVRREVIKYALPLADRDTDDERRYWTLATLWEAYAGLGEAADAATWEARAVALVVAPWMIESTRTQIETIRSVQAEIARLGRRASSPRSTNDTPS
jgi:hypothetical protein